MEIIYAQVQLFKHAQTPKSTWDFSIEMIVGQIQEL